MRSKLYPTEYLALLTIKYNVDADKFFNALISAEKNQKAQCENLTIECRTKQNQNIIFLITQNTKVVAQLKIPQDLLIKTKNPIKEIRKNYLNNKHHNQKNIKPQTLQIKDLKSGMKKINLEAKIIEISQPKHVITKYGNHARVANATITDDTGKIKLCLWNNQIDTAKPGNTIQIQNAKITTYRNEKQLRINKNGTLHVTKTPLTSKLYRPQPTH
jgi:replication factor A1